MRFGLFSGEELLKPKSLLITCRTHPHKVGYCYKLLFSRNNLIISVSVTLILLRRISKLDIGHSFYSVAAIPQLSARV